MKTGQIVRSVAGRDKNRFFVITSVEDGYATICDGKQRPLDNQKRKKLIHLSKTNYSVNLADVKTNKEFKRVLHRFNYE